MLLDIFVGALLVAKVVFILVVTLPLCRWIQEKTDAQSLANNAKIDDAILDALEVGVSNGDSRFKLDLLAAHDDGKLNAEDKERLRQYAVDVASDLLDAQGIKLHAISDGAIGAMVRRLVDAKHDVAVQSSE